VHSRNVGLKFADKLFFVGDCCSFFLLFIFLGRLTNIFFRVYPEKSFSLQVGTTSVADEMVQRFFEGGLEERESFLNPNTVGLHLASSLVYLIEHLVCDIQIPNRREGLPERISSL
jgi:hypothetical protein